MSSDFVVAVHALAFLCHKGEILSSEVLADNICTHPARVRRVMARLHRAGLVSTREGRGGGGYFVCRAADQLALSEVSRALEVSFADFNWSSGSQDRDCLVCSGMADYITELQGRLNRQCEDYLATVSVADVERWLVDRSTPDC